MDQYGGSDPRGNPKAGHYRSQSSTPSKSPAKSAAKSATQWEDDSESEYSSDYDSGSSYASGSEYSSDYETETQTETDSQYSRESSYTDYTDDDGGYENQDTPRKVVGERVAKAHKQQIASIKTIFVYRNGDAYFPARKVVFGKKVRTFEYLLELVTDQLHPPFGATRKLFDAHGTPVTELGQIKNGQYYVAGPGHKQFAPLPYVDIVDHSEKQRNYEVPDLDKMKYKQKKVKGRNRVEHPLCLYILANRDKDGIPTKIMLKERDRISYQHVLRIITERLGFAKLPANAKKLVNLKTRKHINKISQLEDRNYYCAVDRLEAIRLPPFYVNEANQLVRRTDLPRKKCPNKPIMFDKELRGKVYCGERRLDVLAEQGWYSEIGLVQLKEREPIEHIPGKGRHTGLSRMKPKKKEKGVYLKVDKPMSAMDQALWDYIHMDFLDEMCVPLIEEAIKEQYERMYQLLNGYVVARQHKDKVGKLMRRAAMPKGNAFFNQGGTNSQAQELVLPAIDRALNKSRSSDHGGRESRGGGESNADSSFPGLPPPTFMGEGKAHLDDMVDDVIDYFLRPSTDVFARSASDEEKALAKRFGQVSDAAVDGKLQHWEDGPRSLVALIIALDQFPRTISKGTPEMYRGDKEAAAVITRAVSREDSVLVDVPPMHVFFCCLALSHHESTTSQTLALKLWEQVSPTFSSTDPVLRYGKQFKTNCDLVKKFKRFPQRNDLLGRTSTEEEDRYLNPPKKAASPVGEEPAKQKSKRFSVFRKNSRKVSNAKKLSKKEKKELSKKERDSKRA